MPNPARRLMLYIDARIEQLLLQPVITNGSIETLNIGALLRLFGLNVCDPDFVFAGSGFHSPADILEPVIPPYPFSFRRHLIICSSSRNNRSAGKEKSASIPSASRFKSSITFSNQNGRQSLSLSCIKSSDQTPLIVPGKLKVSGFSLKSHSFGLIRKFSSNSL